MIYLMLHDDWEINGDGTGNPIKLMFDPAKRNLDICDKHGAKYTFYAEIGQQINMLNSINSKWHKLGVEWERILKDAVCRGHDVQLHLHPQWIGAKIKNNKWELDFNKWNSYNVSYELLEKWISDGVAYLRNLLEETDSNYRLLSFRAGGWMCQPSEKLYESLKENGITCDVTVMKGRYKKYSDGSYIDFRYAPSYYEPWEVCPDNFSCEGKDSAFWEIPVYTEVSNKPHIFFLLSKSFAPYYYFKIMKKVKSKNRTYSPKSIETSPQKDYYGSFGYMHYKHLVLYVRKMVNISEIDKRDYPLIFLTHSKSFYDSSNFEKLLIELKNNKNLKFTTTYEYIQKTFLKDIQ